MSFSCLRWPIEAHGKPTAILLTSDSHDRDAAKIKDHYQIPVYIHESMGSKVEGIADTLPALAAS